MSPAERVTRLFAFSPVAVFQPINNLPSGASGEISAKSRVISSFAVRIPSVISNAFFSGAVTVKFTSLTFTQP